MKVSQQSNDFLGGGNTETVLTLKELEASTIEKQRKELHILLSELKDRDRELNGMVTSHQQHLSAWETDRQRSLYMEQKLKRYECKVVVYLGLLFPLTLKSRINFGMPCHISTITRQLYYDHN